MGGWRVKVLRSIPYKTQSFFKRGSVVTLGSFDGLHLAHQQLLQETITLAKQKRVPSVLLTFQPHPKDYFSGGESQVRLMRLREKWLALQPYALDFLVCLRFNRAMATMPAIDFVNQFLVDRLNVKAVIIGDDFRFGASRQGDYALLASLGEQYGFQVHQIPSMTVHGMRVSSTQVRQLLSQGNIAEAQKLMGRAYSLYGPVVRGDQRGRTWGFPTASIPLYRTLSPLTGVFVVRVHGPGFVAHGVASIGYRPVFKVEQPLLEVFILDFNREIYGEYLWVEFLHQLREELNFDSVDDLVAQIGQDVVDARAWLR